MSRLPLGPVYAFPVAPVQEGFDPEVEGRLMGNKWEKRPSH